MVLEGVVVGLLDDRKIVMGTAFLHSLHQVAKLGQRKGRGCNLVAQARHDGLYPPRRRASQKAVGTYSDYKHSRPELRRASDHSSKGCFWRIRSVVNSGVS